MSELHPVARTETSERTPEIEGVGAPEARVSLADVVAEVAAQVLESLTIPVEQSKQAESSQQSALQDETIPPVGAAPAPHGPALHVMHVADFYRRYPGEDVTFFTRVKVLQAVAGYRLRVELPIGVRLAATKDTVFGLSPDLEVAHEDVASANGFRDVELRTLVWSVEKELAAGVAHDFEVRITIPPIRELRLEDSPIWPGADYWLVSHAQVEQIDATGGQSASGSATVAVAVFPKSSYLRHLPALYERDDFMGRFLMLFESFWAPIEMQVNGIDDYFDPNLAPEGMLHWMAERLNLQWDPQLPETSQRNLLGSAVQLYRKRGTRQGLQEVLEIHTNGAVEIVEHRAENFRIGKGARLGHGVALGSRNQPHTFTARLRLPPLPQSLNGRPVDAGELERLEKQRRDHIRAIIDAEKPAHVTYALEFDSP